MQLIPDSSWGNRYIVLTRGVLVSIVSLAILYAQDVSKDDEPVRPSPVDQLLLAREQVVELQAELKTVKAEVMWLQAENEALQARYKYETVVAGQRLKYNAPKCDVKVDQTWACPPKLDEPHKP